MKTQRILAVLVLLAVSAIVPAVTASAPLATPKADGCFYGDNDVANYDHHVGALGAGGTLHWTLAGNSLFLAVEVSPREPYVNDNVFGKTKESPGDTDVAYLQSAGWSGNGSQHRADALVNSDAVTINLSCGTDSWTWTQDYAYDEDGDPFDGDWKSDHLGGDGSGSGPVVRSASTFQWNMNNTTWDVTLGGARSGSSEWRSPDGPDDQDPTDPFYLNGDVLDDDWGEGKSWYWSDSVLERGWEWVMVYETEVDVKACNNAGAPITVEVLSAHNSPPKEGDPDIPIPVADFGDAPDPAYPTLLASMGAHHVLPLMGGGPTLGPTVDADADGQPEAHAQGDDYGDEGDDEDGVCFCADPVLWGTTPRVDVEISGQECFVNAWVDFGGDGDWAEGVDQILADLSLSAGTTHYPTFTVPGAPAEDPWLVTYARFRCSTVNMADGGYTQIGRAPDGEVEDYELVVSDVPVEFGDLPDGYGTTLGQSGAYHFVASDFFLGLSADGEGNGNPSPGADGDDTCPASGADDEDGVEIPTNLTPGAMNSLEVFLTDGSSRGGVLDAWMDFDGNGWDEGDRIATGYDLVAGWNTIDFWVPDYGPPGNPGGLSQSGAPLYSRFRLTEKAALTSASTMGPVAIAGVDLPTGPGGIGEVEDHLTESPTAVTVASFTASQAGASVFVQWQTATEIDNLGFNLYRAAPEGGARTKLNDALIPSKMPPGSPVGALYEFSDGTPEPGVTYDYWLEAIDVCGQVETYGPVSAGVLTMMIDPGVWGFSSGVEEGGE